MTEAANAPRDGSSLSRVRAVTRAVSILRTFTSRRPYLALGEIAKLTGLDAGTTRRLLVTLRDEALVRQDPATGLYCASVGLLALGHAVPQSLSLTALVEQRVKRLADETQTTVYLSVPSGDMALCTAMKHGGMAIQVRWWAVGEERALNVGAGPRVLLAYQPAARQAQLMSSVLGLGPSEAQALQSELDSIRQAGSIVKHDEIAPGLSAAAVPVLDQSGEILAAVSTGGLTPRYTGAQQVELLALMSEAARDMEESLQSYIL